MFKNLAKKVFGDPSEREARRLTPLVERINALEPEFERMSDEQLAAQTDEFRAAIAARVGTLRDELEEARAAWLQESDSGMQTQLRLEVDRLRKELRQAEAAAMEEALPRAFAAVREAARRTLGMRHFDVQLIGGIVLHQGKIAEMKTGEGKTLVATLPLYLNALTGRGAHLVTPNDYLSKYGVQWMGPVYHKLGVSVGVIQSAAANPDLGSFVFDPEYPAADDRYLNLRPVSRREAYQADITYGTNNEFGFDYLRDNMVHDLSECVQRELHYAIVDEVDNILIDEARTPLIISGQAQESSDLYAKFAQVVRRLTPEAHYKVDEKDRIVTLTDEGIARIEQILGLVSGQSLYDAEHYEMTPYLDNALRAHVLYHLDRDYIVKAGEVIIVDEFTGRLMYGRRFSEGLHQAIEAKEGVRVQRESLTLATITFQNYFRMYEKLAGMTGTALTEAEEFGKIYNLDVVAIPTHRPVIREDMADQVYKTQRAKFKAVVDEIAACRESGQPVLVGTVAIETSEMLSDLLKRRGVPHNVLNAKQHEREAGIIAQAGRSGMVTIATNMAGRGVDILLGGNPEGMARERLRKEDVDLASLSEDDPTWQAALAEARAEVERDRQTVLAAGGLHVVGTERHEARRIDNQLRGRAGRQGDPGSSRFFISLEDDLMRRFGGQSVAGVMERLGLEEDVPIEHNMVSKAIASAQVRVEGYNFDIRKHVLEYDDVVNRQREVIYNQRRQIMSEPTMRPTILGMVEDELRGLVDSFTKEQDRREWDLDALASEILKIMPLPESEDLDAWRAMNAGDLADHLVDLAQAAYDERERVMGAEAMRQIERLLMLRAVDGRWVRHLTDLDELREGIGLRAIAQQDPLVAYKKEAHEMYQEFVSSIAHDLVYAIYHAQVITRPRLPVQRMQVNRTDSGPSQRQPVRSAKSELGRNDPCWCGSGKKYKNCHMRADQGREMAPVAPGEPGATRQPAPAAAPARGNAGPSRPGGKRNGRR
ncbi:MAG: preprotein translocase subunit SecA [Chloroflexi bacterium ADurb.Bin325]|nr:MAG: preprotein translocase subunit SecA [Chloroflexi bacterium ADurb.Bin325]